MALRFVSSSRGNAFMTELLSVLCAELVEQGVDAQVVLDRFPDPQPGLAYVVIPHEYFATTAVEDQPTDAQLRRTIALTTEQPGSAWFENAVAPARRCGLIADISTVGVLEWRRRGVVAEHIALGYTAAWDTWGGDVSAHRDTDITVLGSMNRRRDHYLAQYADVFAEHESRLVLVPIEPKPDGRPGVLLGAERSALLARTRVVLQVRIQHPPYFEWLRAIQAMSAGAVLVTEHGAGSAPLAAGEHYVSGAPENLGLLADALLRQPDELARLQRNAYAAMRAAPSMAQAAARLAELGADLAEQPLLPPATAEHARLMPPDVGLVDPAEHLAAALPSPDGTVQARIAAKRMMLEVGALRRQLCALELRQRGEDPDELLTILTTPAFDVTAPRVTVAITLFEHQEHIEAAIASVAAQDSDEPFELVVLDDASTDHSPELAAAALSRRPWLAARLLARRVNAGLPRGRNDLLEIARGEYMLTLDSDNRLYPQAIRRLSEALDAAPEATFAYGPMVGRRGESAESLLSYLAWDPSHLREFNPIDALSLLRRDAIIELGGFSDDPRLHGWEDYDLWCRIAEVGGEGTHVPNVVARYERSGHSMLSLTDLDQSVARMVLAQRSPRTMAAALDA